MPLTLSGTNGVSGIDGSAGTPTERGSDADTGVFYPSAGNIAISTNGTEALRVDSSQNVGIGTTSPSYACEIKRTGAICQLAATSNSVGYVYANYISGGTSVTTALISDSTTSYVSAETNNALVLRTNGTERARIDTSGNLLVGRTSQLNVGKIESYNSGNGNGFVSQVSNNVYSNFQGFNAAGSATFGVTGAGALTKASGTFKIDHPLPALTDTHHLVHSFIEGPQADLIYRGKAQLVNGVATVNIDEASNMTDGTFVLLCREVQCFTTNETDWTPVRGAVSGNILTIQAQDLTASSVISWLVIGERQDKHMYETDWTDDEGKVIVEPLKAILEEAN